jgi:hypothetical protein
MNWKRFGWKRLRPNVTNIVTLMDWLFVKTGFGSVIRCIGLLGIYMLQFVVAHTYTTVHSRVSITGVIIIVNRNLSDGSSPSPMLIVLCAKCTDNQVTWQDVFQTQHHLWELNQTLWPESASELYRPGDRRLPAKLVPTFADRVSHVVSVTDPYGRNLGFLDWSRYYFFQTNPQLYSQRWVDPVPDPLLLHGIAGSRTRDLWICSQELWPLDYRGGLPERERERKIL